MKALGFSLAEVLLALLILGQIATFAIPKVLTAQQDARKKAIFKETIATISELMYEGVLTGGISDPSTLAPYILGHVNGVKTCTNSFAQGCWTHNAIVSGNRTEAGFVLHNGATVCGIDTDADYQEEIEVDYNGPDGPNLEGEDQMALDLCFGDGSDCSGSTRQIPGTAEPIDYGGGSIALYQEIFK